MELDKAPELVASLAALAGSPLAWVVAAALLSGLLCGVLVFAVQHARRSRLELQLRLEREAAAEKLAVLDDARKRLSDEFQSLASEALARNNENFVALAHSKLEGFQKEAEKDLDGRRRAIDDLVGPIRESLGKVDEKLQTVEKEREGHYAALTRELSLVTASQEKLRGETSNLVQALRAPTVRGRWGEIQLRRVAELAGMLDRCDFQEQTTQTNDEKVQRPDVIVNLPGEKCIVVDAKVPLDAYLAAIEANDEETRTRHLQMHARKIREHMQKLSSKAYWQGLEASPDFVVMFLPGEVFYSAALEQDPTLIEQGFEKKVVLASPTTLIALLRAVYVGWNQEQLATNAKKISEEGRRLYQRVVKMVEHFDKLGASIGKSMDQYNTVLGTLDTRVIVSARRLHELGAGSDEKLPEAKPVEKTVRALQSPEFSAPTAEPHSAPTEPQDVQDA